MSQMNHTGEQEPQTPNLDAVPKQDLFQVPSGYFESLPDAIMQRIAGEEKQEPLVITLPSRRVYWAAASIAACMLTGLSLYFWHRAQSEALSNEAIVVAQDSAKQINAQVVVNQQPVADKKDIVNYLMENDVDLSNITEEL
jgi:hypothetical protein